MENIQAYIIIAAIVAIIIFAAVKLIQARNKFESLKLSVEEESSNLNVYVDKRNEYQNQALAIARINYNNEAEIISRLTQDDQLDQLAYLGQRCPDLRASEGYNYILQQTRLLSDEISASRVLLNSNITVYNRAVRDFPNNIIAGMLGYKPEDLIDQANLGESKKLSKAVCNIPNII